MTSHKCPVKGFETVVIELPEQWLIRHNEKFWSAYRAAGDNVSHGTAQLHGCVAVCDKIEGLPSDKPVDEWPLEVFSWIIEVVWGSLSKALNPAKNS